MSYNISVSNLLEQSVKVINGTILAQDNSFGPEYDLFYCANFVPYFTPNKFIIIGECGFDKEYEKDNFLFIYDEEIDTVTIKNYRTAICEVEEYARYESHIKFATQRNDDMCSMPWIRFPRTKDGVPIPQLIERIFDRIPNVMMFL